MAAAPEEGSGAGAAAHEKENETPPPASPATAAAAPRRKASTDASPPPPQLPIYFKLIESQFPNISEILKLFRPVFDTVKDVSILTLVKTARLIGKVQMVRGTPFPLPLLSDEGGSMLYMKAEPSLRRQLRRFVLYSICTYSSGDIGMDRLMLRVCQAAGVPGCTFLHALDPELDIIKMNPSNVGSYPAFILFADHRRRELVLSVRGSAEAADWFINLSCHEESGYHAGMESASRALMPVVVPHIQTFFDSHPHYNLHCCGHSLGGGVASLLVIRLREEGYFLSQKPRAWAFGAPCTVGREVYETSNHKFREYITSVVYGHDIVARTSQHSVVAALHCLRVLASHIEANDAAESPTTSNFHVNFGLSNGVDLLRPVSTAVVAERKSSGTGTSWGLGEKFSGGASVGPATGGGRFLSRLQSNSWNIHHLTELTSDTVARLTAEASRKQQAAAEEWAQWTQVGVRDLRTPRNHAAALAPAPPPTQPPPSSGGLWPPMGSIGAYIQTALTQALKSPGKQIMERIFPDTALAAHPAPFRGRRRASMPSNSFRRNGSATPPTTRPAGTPLDDPDRQPSDPDDPTAEEDEAELEAIFDALLSWFNKAMDLYGVDLLPPGRLISVIAERHCRCCDPQQGRGGSTLSPTATGINVTQAGRWLERIRRDYERRQRALGRSESGKAEFCLKDPMPPPLNPKYFERRERAARDLQRRGTVEAKWYFDARSSEGSHPADRSLPTLNPPSEVGANAAATTRPRSDSVTAGSLGSPTTDLAASLFSRYHDAHDEVITTDTEFGVSLSLCVVGEGDDSLRSGSTSAPTSSLSAESGEEGESPPADEILAFPKSSLARLPSSPRRSGRSASISLETFGPFLAAGRRTGTESPRRRAAAGESPRRQEAAGESPRRRRMCESGVGCSRGGLPRQGSQTPVTQSAMGGPEEETSEMVFASGPDRDGDASEIFTSPEFGSSVSPRPDLAVAPGAESFASEMWTEDKPRPVAAVGEPRRLQLLSRDVSYTATELDGRRGDGRRSGDGGANAAAAREGAGLGRSLISPEALEDEGRCAGDSVNPTSLANPVTADFASGAEDKLREGAAGAEFARRSYGRRRRSKGAGVSWGGRQLKGSSPASLGRGRSCVFNGHVFVDVRDAAAIRWHRTPVLTAEAVSDHIVDAYCNALAPDLVRCNYA